MEGVGVCPVNNEVSKTPKFLFPVELEPIVIPASPSFFYLLPFLPLHSSSPLPLGFQFLIDARVDVYLTQLRSSLLDIAV